MCTGYLDLEDEDHPKTVSYRIPPFRRCGPPPNRGGMAPAQTKHATMPIFGMDGPNTTTTNLTGAIFLIRPLGRDMVFFILFFDLGVPQTYPHISAQGSNSKNRSG